MFASQVLCALGSSFFNHVSLLSPVVKECQAIVLRNLGATFTLASDGESIVVLTSSGHKGGAINFEWDGREFVF